MLIEVEAQGGTSGGQLAGVVYISLAKWGGWRLIRPRRLPDPAHPAWLISSYHKEEFSSVQFSSASTSHELLPPPPSS